MENRSRRLTAVLAACALALSVLPGARADNVDRDIDRSRAAEKQTAQSIGQIEASLAGLASQAEAARTDVVIKAAEAQRAQRNLEDTEFLTREIAALRLAMNDVATRDFVRSELRDMLSEILAEERLTREEIAEFQDSGDDEPDTVTEQRTAQ